MRLYGQQWRASGAARGRCLFTDPRYTTQSAQECDCPAQTVEGSTLGGVAREIASRNIPRIGFERNRISFLAHDFLRGKLPATLNLIPVEGEVEKLRMVKSQAEIALIRASVQLNSEAYERALARFKPTMRECDLALEIDLQMRRLGAEGTAFETIVAAGERAALPHARPTHQKIGANRLLLVDMGASLDGYASDMTRTAAVGKPSQPDRDVYHAVLEAQRAAVAAVKPGIRVHEVDRAARSVLDRHGLGSFFVHSTGHGLGLEIHEPPRLGQKEKPVLEEGMAITIEPGVYRPGQVGVRIEDTVLVTARGCEVLTPTSKELRLL